MIGHAVEPPIYRPFAGLAFGVALLGGVPLGLWMLGWRYLGAPAPAARWVLLHAHLQIFGLFGLLIPGVAPHLVARFTGTAIAPTGAWRGLAVTLATGLALRVAGTGVGAAWPLVVASAVETGAYAVFGWWVWRRLDPAPLAVVRGHLTTATGWLAGACLLETLLRLRSLWLGFAVPSLGAMRAVYAMALLGGVLGWMLGVLLRAGPMFVAGWRVPASLARAVPWMLATGVGTMVAVEVGPWPLPVASRVGWAGEALALGTGAVVLVGAGVFRRARGSLPLVSRSAPEARIVRVAALCAVAATIGAAAAAGAGPLGVRLFVIDDALRHLVTVGWLTSIVVAMTFRLMAVLEAAPLPWPALRGVALAALVAAVVLRSAEVLVPEGWPALAPLVVFSGLLVWTAFACVGLNLVAIVARRR